MRVQSSYKRENVQKDTGSNKANSVLEGINSQIKVLRSMMISVDQRHVPVAANRVNEMKTNIMLGSVYPLQNSRYIPVFFAQKVLRREAVNKRA